MLLLTNGTIATMDPARPMAEAAVVDGAYFAYVGGRADAEDFARRFSRGAWETLDLQGRFVMPGFNDSHLHFIHYVKTKLSVNLIEDVIAHRILLRNRKRYTFHTGEDRLPAVGSL